MSLTPEIIAAVIAAVVAIAVILVLLRRHRGGVATAGGARQAAPAVGTETPPAATLRDSLTKTRQGFLARLQGAWGAGKDAEARFAELEEVLITADIGVKATQSLLAKLRPRAKALGDSEALRGALRDEMRAVLANGEASELETKPHVILVAGV